MKVGNVTERTGTEGGASSALDTDEMDRAGIDLGATGRLQLMAKLAEGQSRLPVFIFLFLLSEWGAGQCANIERYSCGGLACVGQLFCSMLI